MIDNIVVRLHGINQPVLNSKYSIDAYKKGFALMYVPAHFDLYKKIMEYKGKAFTMSRIFNKQQSQKSTISEEEFLLTQTSRKLNDHYLNLDKIAIVNEKEVKERNLKVNGKYRVPSSEHDVVYSVNLDGGFIEFNINVPKYLYGHNMAQFIPQINSELFSSRKGNFNQWKVQKHYLHDRVYEFIDSFFTDLFFKFELELMPDYDYIELNRIDLSYNQYFKNKTEALMYLDGQKKIHKKRSRLKNKKIGDYETSIAYHTSNGSYFKIYHKGSEYVNVKHGDFKKHSDINRNYIRNQQKYLADETFKKHNQMIFKLFKNDTLGKYFEKPERPEIKKVVNEVYKDLPINTMFLKKEMDNILRYEISLTTKSLARIYKTKTFRSKCPYHQEAKRTYKNVKRYDARLNKKKLHRVTKNDRETFKQMSRFFNNGCFILLSREEKYKEYQKSGIYDYNPEKREYKTKHLYAYLNKGTLLETRDIGFFSKPFLKLLIDEFKQQIDYYQIEELKPFDDLVSKVREYNREVVKNLLIYNDREDWRTWEILKVYDSKGKPKEIKQRRTKGNKLITKASQLLTESQRRKAHLQGINITNIIEIFRLMHEEKMTPSQVKEYLKLTKSSFSRRMAILRQLGVKEQTMSIPKLINVKTDFTDYYFKTGSRKYRNNFYLNPKHSEINTSKNNIITSAFYQNPA